MTRTELKVGGLTGQGVMLCGALLGRAATVHAGLEACLIQSLGAEARGSACSAQLILADGPIGHPYVQAPDVLVLLSQGALDRFIPQLKPGGLVLYESELVNPKDRLPQGARAVGVPATRFAEEAGRRLVLNIVMAGFVAGMTRLLPLAAMEKALLASVPRGTEDLNVRALNKGYQFALSNL